MSAELFKLGAPMEQGVCGHPKVAMTERRASNGAIHYQEQCQTCGAKIGNFVKKEIAQRASTINFNQTLYDEGCARESTVFAQERASELAERRAVYAEYLNSAEWRRRRQQVLERENHRCQGCRATRATQVHHLTYAHVRDELLYELVALCDDCHAKAHGESPSSLIEF